MESSVTKNCLSWFGWVFGVFSSVDWAKWVLVLTAVYTALNITFLLIDRWKKYRKGE